MRLSPTSSTRRARPARGDSAGDRILHAVCALAGLIALALVVEIVRELVRGAGPAISRYGLAFVVHSRWAPNFGRFGGAQALYGTGVTSAIALALAAPMGLAIGLYLGVLAPSSVRAVVGPLVELLAAIPSVIVGFWGVDVLAPFVARHLEPPLHAVLGGIPLFGAPQTTGLGVFTAGLTLALMVIPIVAALSRDLFATVPRELTDGASALGATRWEVIRGVVLPATASGLAAAIVLGLGRALGEAIAVLQVIGDGEGIHASLFLPGNALAPRIAQEFISPVGNEIPALFYLGLILLSIELSISLAARWIGRRFDVTRALSG